MIVQYLPLGFSALPVTWFLVKKKRGLPTTDELLRQLHPDTLKDLDKFLPHNPIKDLLDSDKEFWRLSGGYKGLLLRFENALCFVQLCQRLERDNRMPKRAVRSAFRKAFWVLFFSVAALPGELSRTLFRKQPHICARIATYFYWELKNRAEALNLEFGTANWNSHA